ncbi:uncharacterized protein EURHEDRAFT_539688 [Aspergillus ruber CBS 135680]|uniref:Uncharacterized protein n=1 Tax=Aspergillus ruber (strain CBS 135680) TaxID=1388766 RepID=A0A017SBP8_ASPRC|nr:uncharacterized protein EURHEDRAFT_539688 [Aspergillus ruber CBS 135680]EYE94029.1 hypothetical protein EURHEDRAFT_539688 [Aspergillus ruber CBS 135680]
MILAALACASHADTSDNHQILISIHFAADCDCKPCLHYHWYVGDHVILCVRPSSNQSRRTLWPQKACIGRAHVQHH